VSNVRGDVAEGKTAVDVLRATFPAGTLTGAPKIRAMENHRRAGAAPARHLRRRRRLPELHRQPRPRHRHPHPGGAGDKIFVQAAPGLVYDSDAQREHEETVNKARAVLRAVQLARGT